MPAHFRRARTAGIALSFALLTLARCGLQVDQPALLPNVNIYDLAEFSDTDYDYAAAIALGDVDGDGKPELIVGAPSMGPGRDGIVLFLSLPDFTVVGGVQSPIAPNEPVGAHAAFGSALAIADLDGDGFAELVVGDPTASVADVLGAGLAWVYPGPIADNRFRALHSATPIEGGRFGSVLAAGDLDGDGISDLVVGAPASDGTDRRGGIGVSGQATVEVFYGPGLERTLSAPPRGNEGDFGRTLLVLPTTRGGKLLVGAPETIDASGAPQGRAYVFDSSAHGQRGSSESLLPAPGDALFAASSALGDFDGDGVNDLALLAPAGEGALYCYPRLDLDRGRRLRLPDSAPRRGGPLLRIPDLSRDGADELVLLSHDKNENVSILFSPARGVAHLSLDFAAACGLFADFDGDGTSELLLATPSGFKPHGGFALLRIVAFEWRPNLSR